MSQTGDDSIFASGYTKHVTIASITYIYTCTVCSDPIDMRDTRIGLLLSRSNLVAVHRLITLSCGTVTQVFDCLTEHKTTGRQL